MRMSSTVAVWSEAGLLFPADHIRRSSRTQFDRLHQIYNDEHSARQRCQRAQWALSVLLRTDYINTVIVACNEPARLACYQQTPAQRAFRLLEIDSKFVPSYTQCRTGRIKNLSICYLINNLTNFISALYLLNRLHWFRHEHHSKESFQYLPVKWEESVSEDNVVNSAVSCPVYE